MTLTLAHLASFAGILAAIFYVPGPALLLAMRNTLASGMGVGIATGVGLGIVAAGWTGAALLGLGALLAVMPGLALAIKIVGALYLIWIAWDTWRSAREPIDPEGSGRSNRRMLRGFRAGLLVNLTNPKPILFAASVQAVLFPPGVTWVDALAVFGTHLAIELIGYTLLAVFLSRAPMRAAYARAKPWIDRASALLLGGLGLRMLFAR